ncbi:MAG: hypothetical protein Q7R39_12170, partial [Dehalococcoidia bacterium]|nr:hypothetical protein [Dehalococcoidia bacterium]
AVSHASRDMGDQEEKGTPLLDPGRGIGVPLHSHSNGVVKKGLAPSWGVIGVSPIPLFPSSPFQGEEGHGNECREQAACQEQR